MRRNAFVRNQSTSPLKTHLPIATRRAAVSLSRATLQTITLAAIATSSQASAAVPFYRQTNLVSDVPGFATFTDPHLIAAWGATHSPKSGWWINAPLGGVAVVHDGTGAPAPANNPLVVTIPSPSGMQIPSIPTGAVANTGSNFNLSPNNTNPALFIFVTRTGTISGWNPKVNPTVAVFVVQHPGVADYTGVTIAPRNGADQLYVANFGENRVDVFDSAFQPAPLPAGAFRDPAIPDTFSVFNVQVVRDELYVTFAPKNIFDPTGGGSGQGYVDVFDVNGQLLRRLNNGPWMNAPWGVTLAPDEFGHAGGKVLVGMFGDGGIAVFDAQKGNFNGMVRGTQKNPLTLGKGLWALGFGNDGAAGPASTLFFATDFVIGDTLHGLFGTITPLADTASEEHIN